MCDRLWRSGAQKLSSHAVEWDTNAIKKYAIYTF